MKYGIDLSHWNGEVDFSQINKDFVILKCNQMTFEDVKFIENYNKAKKESLEIGAYIYVGAMTEYEAKLEAETCVNILMVNIYHWVFGLIWKIQTLQNYQ